MEHGSDRRNYCRTAAATLLCSIALVLIFGSASAAGGFAEQRSFLQERAGTLSFASVEGDAPNHSGQIQAQDAAEPATGFWRGLWNWSLEEFVYGASITLGYGVRRSNFNITRRSDGASGTIIDRDYPAYFLTYSTKPTLFTDSSIGYTFMLRLSNFDMNQQVSGKTLVVNEPFDVNTHLEGIVGYAVPSLYYQWGEQRFDGTYFLIGAGLGLMTTIYDGTVQLDSSAGSEVVKVRDQSFSLNLAASAFLEARWRHLGLSLSYTRARLPGDYFDTRFEDVSLYLGYRIFI